MNIALLRDFFFWCAVFNAALLTLWVVVFMTAREWLQRLHGRWFRLSPENFDAIHYSAMALFKIGLILFNIAPLIALYIVG